MPERRDYGRRAEVMRRVVDRLLDSEGGLRDEELECSAPVPGAARRIVKRLALRGLARTAAGRWMPSPVLGRAVSLLRCEPAL